MPAGGGAGGATTGGDATGGNGPGAGLGAAIITSANRKAAVPPSIPKTNPQRVRDPIEGAELPRGVDSRAAV